MKTLKPCLRTLEKFKLGYGQIRAAVVGRHDIQDAWMELADLGLDAREGALAGAITCLLDCLKAIELVSTFPRSETPDIDAFIQSGHDQRHATVFSGLAWPEVHRLATIMAHLVTPYQSMITFDENIPKLVP